MGYIGVGYIGMGWVLGNGPPVPINMYDRSFSQERGHPKGILEWLRFPTQVSVRGEAGEAVTEARCREQVQPQVGRCLEVEPVGDKEVFSFRWAVERL